MSNFARGWAAGLLLLATSMALAQTTSLTDITQRQGFNALERASAAASQATYNQLFASCSQGQGTCSAGDRVVFENVRELVETANELLGSGSTQFSLGLDAQGLGFALRWNAAEEFAAQGSSTSRFAANQMSALATRVSALRWGVSGLRRASNDEEGSDVLVAANLNRYGGGASADVAYSFDRWGWFVDGSFGYGDKQATVQEDAFDFDGQEVTIGMDHRLSSNLVVGLIFGHSDKEIDFDSSLSIVDGGLNTRGMSGILFAMLESNAAYVTGSLGYQKLTHDMSRRITYPSLNPGVDSVDSTASSSSRSSSFLVTLGAGYSWRRNAFSAEPMLELNYSDTSMGAFTESSVDNLDATVANDPFNMRIAGQSIKSLDVATGLKLQYVLAPRIGALIPYLAARHHWEMENGARVIAGQFADALDQIGSQSSTVFALSTDRPDDAYYTMAAGCTLVMGSGMNGFMQYLKVFGLENYSDAVLTGGFRYEF